MTRWLRLLRIMLVFSLLAFGTMVDAEPPQVAGSGPAPSDHSMGRHLSARGLPNFGEVTPQLYRGGQPTPAGFEKLAKRGIAIVVDFGRSRRDERKVKRLGMQYVSLPWHCPFPRDEVFARFLKLIQENPSKKIFAHCRLGDDRTGMMIAAYRMGAQGWSANAAMKEMQQFGFNRSHHLICPGLASYERNFPERLKKSPAFANIRSGETSRSRR